jgi:hypothetical protein
VKALNRIGISGLLLLVGIIILSTPQASASKLSQQPTNAITTGTGTPTGPVIRVLDDNDFINVRSGPGTEYTAIGVLNAGDLVSAFGRTAGGTWIQIAFPEVEGGIGWVYSPLVTLVSGGDLPLVEPPPTATPLVTPTIDPTLASQFINEAPPTRLPTYTQPPPLVISTFEPAAVPEPEGVGFPMGLAIIILGAVGILGTLFVLIRRR